MAGGEARQLGALALEQLRGHGIRLAPRARGPGVSQGAVREGGVIILVAECAEGAGNRTFEAWMTGGLPPAELLARIQKEFVIGGHKAAAIAKVAQKARLFLVAPALVGAPWSGMEHYPTAQAALEAALDAVGPDARVLVLPQAASLLPRAAG